MTPQERQLVDDLFDRLAQVEGAPRDGDAATAINDGLRKAPNALYALVQTVLVQDEALKRANAHIQELEQAHTPDQQQPGGFLDSMRDAVLGKDSQQRGSVPNVPPPVPNRPVWNSGQVLPQSQGGNHFDQGHYDQGGQGPYGQGYGQGPYGQGQGGFGQGQGGFGQSFGAPPFGGGGGSFLGTAAAAAAGMVGGSLLLNGIRGIMGGTQRQAFGDTNVASDRSASPWSDQSGSSLARDAGVNDIGRSGSGSDSGSRAGLFDQASNDRNDDNAQNAADDAADDAMDNDSDNFGSDNDSDYA
jgi:hypothetical protein